MSSPPLPTPGMTPAPGDQHPREGKPDARLQNTTTEVPGREKKPAPDTEEEAYAISDLEYARSKLKDRAGDNDPFSTPTPETTYKPPPSSTQKVQEQKPKTKHSRDPLGQPAHPDQQATKPQGSKSSGSKKQPPKASDPNTGQQKQPGTTLQAGSMPSPALLNQLLPTSEDGIIAIGDFKYTEYPRNQPRLYPRLGHNNLFNHQPQQVLAWNSKKGNKALVREFHAKYEIEVEGKRRLRESIEETLMGFLGHDATFELSDPKVNPLAARNRIDPPWHTLIYNLPDPLFIKLMAHPIIATQKCVLIVSPFHQMIPSYITSITGLTCKSNLPSGRKIATEAARQGLTSDTALANDLDLIAGAGSFQKLVDRLLVYFVNSSETHPNEGWWNVESPGMPKNITIEQYQAFTNRIKKLTFPTEDHGDGSAISRTRECINCKCLSHTANLCPLYNMKGWLGPPKPNLTPKNDDSAPSQSTRGTPRGRGNQTRRGYNNRGHNARRGAAKRG
jgi:hypothetical protein